jgi:hypothetical protein
MNLMEGNKNLVYRHFGSEIAEFVTFIDFVWF